MSDAPENETPIQRALRLKKAAQAGQAPPRGERKGGAHRAANAAASAKSKPWMKK